jgi:hypothetical protein
MRVNVLGRSIAAGLCGGAAHFGLMYLKARTGLLPSFQPYDDLQRALAQLFGEPVHPVVPWALSFLNGAVVLGFVFGRSISYLPGRSGAMKGLVFGVLGWLAMGLLFFPWLGRGLFATRAGLGSAPAAFSLAMVLAYSVTMGVVFALLKPKRASGRSGSR